MKRAYVLALAHASGASLSEAKLDELLAARELREAIALGAYAVDLLQRLNGVAVGPASLALWRAFAWKPEGSPKKGFVLTAGAIMSAEQQVIDHLS